MAADSAGQIGLDLVVNQGQFKKQMSGIQGMAKKAGKALAAAFAVKKIWDFGAACIELGSDLAEVQNVVDVTFPRMSKQIDSFAKDAAGQFGLSETMAKKFTGTFGSMAKAFGFTEQSAYEMSTALTGLAGDVASFYNLSQDEAYTKLKAVFTGESEVLKDLGIVMTQTSLDAYAMANGFGKVTAKMSEAEKVALRYKFVTEQLTGASGDFLRTSDGWANQVRVLQLQFDSLKATIGQGLINVLTPVLKLINTLIGRLMTLANAFKAFTELITGGKAKDGSIGLADATLTAEEASGGIAKNTEAAAGAAKEAKKNLSGIDKLNVVSSGSDAGGSAAGSEGVAGGEIDFGALATGETVLEETDKRFQKIFDGIQKATQPTMDALKRLWDEGLSKAGDFAWTGLKDFYDGFLVPVGQWTLGEGIPRFVDALNDGLNAIDWSKINEALRGLWEALTPFAKNVGEGLLWLWENILVPFGTWAANEVVPRYLEGLATVIDIVNTVIEAIKPGLQWFWEELLQPLAKWTGGVVTAVWDEINKALKVFSDWCSDNPKVIETVTLIAASFAASWALVNTAIGIWNAIGVIATAVTSAFGAAVAFLTSPIGIVVLAIGALIAAGILLYKNWDAVKNFVLAIWETIKSCVSIAITAVKDKIATTIETVKTIWETVWGAVSNAFASVWDAIGKRLTSIKDTWKKTWDEMRKSIEDTFNGIWKFLKNIINSILGGIEKMANGVVKAVNKIIESLNNLNFDIPDWVPVVGGKNLGFTIPEMQPVKLPRLAQGGFVQANTPQLAVIGDNMHQGEVVAPEDKLQELLNKAVQQGQGGGLITMELLSLLRDMLETLRRIEGKESGPVITDRQIFEAWRRESRRQEQKYRTRPV